MGKIMVTGALGNVGGYVAKHLLLQDQPVVVADINVDGLLMKYGSDVTARYFDFTDQDTFLPALADVDRVFIMRPPHLGQPEDLKPFIETLSKMQNLELVCFLSLIGVENNPIPPHHKIEKYIQQAKLPYCFIRPSFFMQNLSGIHAFEIKHFDRIVVPCGKALTSFIDAEDIGELSATILSNPVPHLSQGYAITGPQAIDYYQVAKIMSEELGRNIEYSNIQPSIAKSYWIKVRGLDATYAQVMGWLYMMTRWGGAKAVTMTFESLMGKSPQSFRDFVKKQLRVWQP
jgi:uncharacterized protein YbjT (DUF2867 family)